MSSRMRDLYSISRIILVYYCKCCNLIGYSTRYLFLKWQNNHFFAHYLEKNAFQLAFFNDFVQNFMFDLWFY